MEQFKFTKKENKEDFTETAVFEARKECFPHYVARGSSGHVFSQSSEEAKRKPSNYEKTQVRQFQWNWLTLFPWLKINMSCLNSDEEYDISYPYHQVKPPHLFHLFNVLRCLLIAFKSPFGRDKSKKSGTNVFKIETLKKHDKSQGHVSCTETLKARHKTP